MKKPEEWRGEVWAAYVWWRIKRWAKRHNRTVANWGVCNCRKIANSSTWSQHAWCSALDVHPKDRKTGDELKAWLTNKKGGYRFHIHTLLWWVDDHYDHLHLNPKPYSGTPPCAK